VGKCALHSSYYIITRRKDHPELFAGCMAKKSREGKLPGKSSAKAGAKISMIGSAYFTFFISCMIFSLLFCTFWTDRS
jgi:hypothetical protein